MTLRAAALDDPVRMRQADRELLSLALMDARNHLLARLALDESPAALRLALIASFCSILPVQAAVLHVRTDGSDAASGADWEHAKATVGAALLAADAGDEIWVAAGVYAERPEHRREAIDYLLDTDYELPVSAAKKPDDRARRIEVGCVLGKIETDPLKSRFA